MADVLITYETLFDLLRKEKGRAELQHLSEDFYGQAVLFVRKRRNEVEVAGGIAAPAAQKPLIQFRNVQKILRELYERRERKIVEMALNRARTESNLVDTAALLPEERPLYEAASVLLTRRKRELLDPTVKGEAPDGVVVTTLPEQPLSADARAPSASSSAAADGEPSSGAEMTGGEAAGNSPEAVATRESCRVTFLAAVPKFLGLKGEIHGPFEPGDTAELPGKIAAVLLKKKRVDVA